MFQVIHKLISLLHISAEHGKDEDAINETLHGHFLRLRTVDPDTRQQWLRLRRALAQSETYTRPLRSRLAPRFALSAAVVVVAIVGAYVYFSSTQHHPSRFATARGERKEVILNDSSQVTLNYATELVVGELRKGKTRRLSLSGEAYFRVQRDETPFIVSTHYADVRVIGTEFNLRARDEVLEVGVIRGIVKVSVVVDGRDSALLLSQHQMALCSQNGYPRRIENVMSQEYPGWMYGKLFLDRTAFQTACREIEMRFNVSVSIENPNVRDKLITGILDAKTAESALGAICGLTGRRIVHEGQIYHIY